MEYLIESCSLGKVVVAGSERGLRAILIGDDVEALLSDLRRRFAGEEIDGMGMPGGTASSSCPRRRASSTTEFERLAARVIDLIESPVAGSDLPLDACGTDFQQRVWQALRDIPFGGTASYTDIAHAIGAPKAVRAVAQACGANPLAVAIPCHRVVGRDGSLTGYRWGVERKRELLRREKPDVCKSLGQ